MSSSQKLPQKGVGKTSSRPPSATNQSDPDGAGKDASDETNVRATQSYHGYNELMYMYGLRLLMVWLTRIVIPHGTVYSLFAFSQIATWYLRTTHARGGRSRAQESTRASLAALVTALTPD